MRTEPILQVRTHRVRPHQTAYSIGKLVNEGRTRRASVPVNWGLA